MDIQELARFALSAVQTFSSNEDALRAIAGRIGKAAGGSTGAQLETAVDEAVKARKAAGEGMQKAGQFKG